MAKGNGLLIFGVIAAGAAAYALSSKAAVATPTIAPTPGSGGIQPGGASPPLQTPGPLVVNGCQLDAGMPPATVAAVSLLLGSTAYPPSAYTALATQIGAQFPKAAACLNARVPPSPPSSPLPPPGWTMQVDPVALQAALQQQLASALVAGGVDPTTATQLSQNPTILSSYTAFVTGGMPHVQAAQQAASQNTPHF